MKNNHVAAWDYFYEEISALHRAGKIDARKWRFFHCCCCRRVWNLLVDNRSRSAVEVAERFANGEATDLDLTVARQGAEMAADEAWALVESCRRNDTWTWPYTEDVDKRWVAFDASSAAKETVQALIQPNNLPGAAASAVAWAGARKLAGLPSGRDLSELERSTYMVAWNRLRDSEFEAQLLLLHEII